MANLRSLTRRPRASEIAAQAELLTHLSWTPPVLVGRACTCAIGATLMAVDLG